MKKENAVTHGYLDDRSRFADLLNGWLFGGRQMLREEDIEGEANTVYLKLGGEDMQHVEFIEKQRDIIHKVALGTNFILMGIENQSKIHYAMTIRNMIYDAANYDHQWRMQRKYNKEYVHPQTAEEFLSGFQKTDRFMPIISLVVYWGQEPWDAANELCDILDLTDVPEELCNMINNYKIYVLDVRRLENLDQFQSDIGNVFGFIQHSADKAALGTYVEEHANYFENVQEDALDVMLTITKSNAIKKLKPKIQTEQGGYNMCRALEEMCEDARREAAAEAKKTVAEAKRTATKAKKETLKEREKSIRIFIETCQKFGATTGYAMDTIEENYNLSRTASEEYIKRFWKAN